MTDEPRVRFIEHRGKQILLHDFSGIVDPQDGFAVVALSGPIVASQPPGSLLTLINVTGAHYNKDILDALRVLAKHNKPFVKASAMVGVSGLLKIIYVTFTQLSGRRIPVFSTLAEAKDYLVSQA